MNLLWFALGFVFLIAGAEFLVRGASNLALRLGISPLVVGLTVVAYGTSFPELAVTVQAAWQGQPDIALGNVVGSNVANILLILGLSAAVAPLLIDQVLLRRDVPLLVLISVVTWTMAEDGRLGFTECLVLVAGAVGYTALLVWQSRLANPSPSSAPDDPGPVDRAGVGLGQQLALIVLGLAMILLGARWLVQAATAIAAALGVSPLVIGLTVVAVGTSLPELATSVVATLRGQRDIAVGNVVGSNIFNLLFVLGLAGVFSGSGVPVAAAALRFDLPVMTVVAFMAWPIFFTGRQIARWEGFLFLSYYVLYVLYLVDQSTPSVDLGWLNLLTLWVLLPVTVVGLGLSLRKHRRDFGGVFQTD